MKHLNLKDAVYNTRNLKTSFSGHGHYKISMLYRGKTISTTTNNMPAIDDFKSDEFEKDGREYRKLRGYRALISELLRANNK